MPLIVAEHWKSAARRYLLTIGVAFGAGYVTGVGKSDPESHEAAIMDSVGSLLQYEATQERARFEDEYRRNLDVVSRIVRGEEVPTQGSLENRVETLE